MDGVPDGLIPNELNNRFQTDALQDIGFRLSDPFQPASTRLRLVGGDWSWWRGDVRIGIGDGQSAMGGGVVSLSVWIGMGDGWALS